AATLELRQAGPGTPLESVRREARLQAALDDELIIHPRFFRTLVSREPSEWAAARVLLKSGQSRNELTKYRYDVFLETAVGARSAHLPRALRWRDGDGLPQLETFIRESANGLVLTGIIDARVESDVRAVRLMAQPGAPRTVGDLRASASAYDTAGVD